MATGFTGIIFNPTLPRSLNLLRNSLTSALTTSRSEEATAAAVGFYCTHTELRVLITTLLRAESSLCWECLRSTCTSWPSRSAITLSGTPWPMRIVASVPRAPCKGM